MDYDKLSNLELYRLLLKRFPHISGKDDPDRQAIISLLKLSESDFEQNKWLRVALEIIITLLIIILIAVSIRSCGLAEIKPTKLAAAHPDINCITLCFSGPIEYAKKKGEWYVQPKNQRGFNPVSLPAQSALRPADDQDRQPVS